jgi:ketosteroid isomerase-like protein
MSRENVEVVRQVHEAWNRDDSEAAQSLFDPAAEVHVPPGLFLGFESRYYGHEGLRQWWEAAKEPWKYFKSYIEHTVDEGDAVVTLVRFEAVGRESGVKVELPSVGNAWRLRDGRVVSFAAYRSLDEALEAVGLRE